jgi:hypothetical protein
MLAYFRYAGRWPAELRHIAVIWPPAGGVFDVRKMTIDDRTIFDLFLIFLCPPNHSAYSRHIWPITVKYAAYLAAGRNVEVIGPYPMKNGEHWTFYWTKKRGL